MHISTTYFLTFVIRLTYRQTSQYFSCLLYWLMTSKHRSPMDARTPEQNIIPWSSRKTVRHCLGSVPKIKLWGILGGAQDESEHTLWCHQTWLAGKSPNWMEVSSGKSLFHVPFSIAMFDYRRVDKRKGYRWSIRHVFRVQVYGAVGLLWVVLGPAWLSTCPTCFQDHGSLGIETRNFVWLMVRPHDRPCPLHSPDANGTNPLLHSYFWSQSNKN